MKAERRGALAAKSRGRHRAIASDDIPVEKFVVQSVTPKIERRARGPADPERRNRIAEATLAVIAQHGIEGVTHRAVASVAAVPVSSTLYYFGSRVDLLAGAMAFAIENYDAYIRAWRRDLTRATLGPALADYLVDTTATQDVRRPLVVSFELYLGSLRYAELHPLAVNWDRILTDVLLSFMAEPYATGLHALTVGLQLRAIMDNRAIERSEAAATIDGFLTAVPAG